MTTHLFSIVDEPEAGTFTLDNFLKNNEGFPSEDADAIRALPVGGVFASGGGAAAEWAIVRVQ